MTDKHITISVASMAKDQLEDRLKLMEAHVPVSFLDSPIFLRLSLGQIESYLERKNGNGEAFIKESFNDAYKIWSETYSIFKEPDTRFMDKYSGLCQRMILEPLSQEIDNNLKSINNAFENRKLQERYLEVKEITDLMNKLDIFIQVGRSYSEQKILLRHYIGLLGKSAQKEVMKYFNNWIEGHLAKLMPYAEKVNVQLNLP